MNSSAKTNAGAKGGGNSWWADNWKALLAVLAVGLLPFLPVLLAGEVLFASDQMGSPAWKWFFDGLHRGEIGQWNPFIFGGMPTLDANAGSMLYPPVLLMGFLLPVTHFMTWDLTLHVLIAGGGAFFLLQRYFRLDRWLAVSLAVAYMLNTGFISLIYGGHDGKVHILAWLPYSLYFLFRALGPSPARRHLIGLALTIAAFVLTSHLQFTYFVLMGYFFAWLYFLGRALRARRFGEAGGIALRYWVPLLLGIGLVFFMFYPPMKYNQDFSIRGAGPRTTFEHATSWSMHPEETASLIIPEFGGLNQNYWGRNYFKLNSEYPGLLVWFLGLLGLLTFRRVRWFWLWGGVGLLSIIYGLGAHTPFFRLFYEFVPGVRVFRAPSMMLFWLSAALLLMSAETLRRLTVVGRDAMPDVARGAVKRKLSIAGYSVAGVLAIFGLLPALPYGIWNAFVDGSQIPNLPRQDAAQAAFALGALRTAALVALLTWGTCRFLLAARRTASFAVLALVVAVVDLYWVNSNFIEGVPKEAMLRHDPAIEFLKSDKTRHRVFGLPGVFESGINPQYEGIEHVDGRIDNELVHYRTYRGEDYQNNPNFVSTLLQNPDGSVGGSLFLDHLNVKYVAFRVPNDPGIKLVQNATMLPRVWFVPAWEAVTDSQALQALKGRSFDPRRVALVSTPGFASGGAPADSTAPPASIREEVYRYNRLAWSVTVPTEGVMVMADIWFPNWRVTVDGEEAPLLRTNFAFRGVKLAPGTHLVELKYVSPWMRTGILVSLASLVVLVIFASLYARFGRPTILAAARDA